MQIAQVLAGYTLGGPICYVRKWVRKSRKKWPSSAVHS